MELESIPEIEEQMSCQDKQSEANDEESGYILKYHSRKKRLIQTANN